MGALAALLIGGLLGCLLGYWACADKYEDERAMTLDELAVHRAKARRVVTRQARREAAR
jgi:hypothetical protein